MSCPNLVDVIRLIGRLTRPRDGRRTRPGEEEDDDEERVKRPREAMEDEPVSQRGDGARGRPGDKREEADPKERRQDARAGLHAASLPARS
jgi:hypothetical protein